MMQQVAGYLRSLESYFLQIKQSREFVFGNEVGNGGGKTSLIDGKVAHGSFSLRFSTLWAAYFAPRSLLSRISTTPADYFFNNGVFLLDWSK